MCYGHQTESPTAFQLRQPWVGLPGPGSSTCPSKLSIFLSLRLIFDGGIKMSSSYNCVGGNKIKCMLPIKRIITLTSVNIYWVFIPFVVVTTLCVLTPFVLIKTALGNIYHYPHLADKETETLECPRTCQKCIHNS